MHAMLPAPDRCVVVGVVNVTPDSFSDGGRYHDHADAVRHGIEIAGNGADLVDVGGESTRPGAERVAPEIEAKRVVPVIRDLAAAGVAVSVDTMRAQVAREALDAGATVVNDVSGGLADPDMVKLVADAGVPWFLMHWRGHSKDMNALASYDDVVTEVVRELSERVDAAICAGVGTDALVVDPGLGFAKRAEHDWALLRNLDAVKALGLPVLIGASRKRFLGAILGGPQGPRPASQRDVATSVVSAFAAEAGVWGVRVHDVVGSLDAITVARALRPGTETGGPS